VIPGLERAREARRHIEFERSADIGFFGASDGVNGPSYWGK
jgi:hypothetical protein